MYNQIQNHTIQIDPRSGLKYKTMKPPCLTRPNNKPVSPKEITHPVQKSSQNLTKNLISSANNRREGIANIGTT
jgi:hypothetical protein